MHFAHTYVTESHDLLFYCAANYNAKLAKIGQTLESKGEQTVQVDKIANKETF